MKHFFFPALVSLLLMGCLQAEDTSPRFPLIAKLKKRIEALRTDPSNIDRTVQPNDAPEEMKETWLTLFDGETMAGWMVPVYGGDGEVEVQDGNIVIGRGEMMTGIRYEKEFPVIDYEIRYEARRMQGYDFFAACTFPMKTDYCTFINGGWGGGAIGLSSINGYDASENETSDYFAFRDKTWHRFRIRVESEQIQIWITPQNREGDWGEEKLVVDVEIDESKKLSTRYEVNLYKPLGFSTWSSEGQLRNIEYRKIGK